MKTPEQIFDEAIKAKGLDVVSVKDADLYEAGLDAITKALSLGVVGGSLRELADKYEMDALERYETGDHALSHIHMAAQARYGFENGWNAAKKQ